jgi:hypothetical protein
MRQRCLHELLPCLQYNHRQTPGKGAKGRTIDHWCRASSHEGPYAIKELQEQRGPVVPGAPTPPTKAKRIGWAVKYGPEIVGLLKAIWLQHGQPCGKRLLAISASQIDRLLAPNTRPPAVSRERSVPASAPAHWHLGSQRHWLAGKSTP